MIIAGIPFTMPAIWIGLIVIFLIVEGLTAGLVTIWFAVGALAALIAAMFHAPLWLQLVWFFAVSIAAFAVTRTNISPSFAYGAAVGLLFCVRSSIISATAASPRP